MRWNELFHGKPVSCRRDKSLANHTRISNDYLILRWPLLVVVGTAVSRSQHPRQTRRISNPPISQVPSFFAAKEYYRLWNYLRNLTLTRWKSSVSISSGYVSLCSLPCRVTGWQRTLPSNVFKAGCTHKHAHGTRARLCPTFSPCCLHPPSSLPWPFPQALEKK